MNSLSVNTSATSTSICINSNNNLHSKFLDSNKPNHCEVLIPMVNEALSETGISLKNLDEIRVNTGPGNLVSLRIGITFVNVLSRNLNIPVYGIPSFYAHINRKKIQKSAYLIAINIRNGFYSYAKIDSCSMQIIDFNLRASKNILHSISLNDCVLLSDSLIDDVLIDMGFKENIISADDLARVDVYNLTSLVQQDSPIKPINEYSFIVNN